MLLTNAGGWTERALLKMVIRLYRQRLRRSIAHLPPGWSSEILTLSTSMDNTAPHKT